MWYINLMNMYISQIEERNSNLKWNSWYIDSKFPHKNINFNCTIALMLYKLTMLLFSQQENLNLPSPSHWVSLKKFRQNSSRKKWGKIKSQKKKERRWNVIITLIKQNERWSMRGGFSWAFSWNQNLSSLIWFCLRDWWLSFWVLIIIQRMARNFWFWRFH